MKRFCVVCRWLVLASLVAGLLSVVGLAVSAVPAAALGVRLGRIMRRSARCRRR